MRNNLIDDDRRSEELHDIINARPHGIAKFGIPISFLILLILLLTSFIVKYPDTVNATAVILSDNFPREIIIKEDNRLSKLFFKEKDHVIRGQILGYFESNADPDIVLEIDHRLKGIRNKTQGNAKHIFQFLHSNRQSDKNLGELQEQHQTFIKSLLRYLNFIDEGFYIKKKAFISKDLANCRAQLLILNSQRDLIVQDVELSTQDYSIYDTLHNEKIVNDLDFRRTKSQYINKKLSIPQIESAILQKKSEENSLEKDLLELNMQIEEETSLFFENIDLYLSAIKAWENRFVIISPSSGELVYSGFLGADKHVRKGDVLCFILNEPKDYEVEMLIPQQNFGKVKVGQTVLLRLPSFPDKEYGTISGIIESIKNIPSDSGYLSKVRLPSGLLTNFRKRIGFTEGLKANAQIITDKRRLSQRIFSKL